MTVQRFMFGTWALALVVALAVGCSGEVKQAGGLEIVVSTDLAVPAQLAAVRIVIDQRSGTGWDLRLDKTISQPTLVGSDFPLHYAITAGTSTDQEALIDVTGMDRNGTPIVFSESQLEVPVAGVKELDVRLSSGCLNRVAVGDAGVASSCGSGSSCVVSMGVASCASTMVVSANLPDYSSQPPDTTANNGVADASLPDGSGDGSGKVGPVDAATDRTTTGPGEGNDGSLADSSVSGSDDGSSMVDSGSEPDAPVLPPPCGAANCPTGCCDSNGVCQMGNAAGACGTGGAQCATCSMGNACVGGACSCGGMSCSGCCGADGTCTTSTNLTCGASGGMCVACNAGQECSTGGKCVCDATSCPDGCCSGNTCVKYAQQGKSQCGAGGAACGSCASTQACSAAGVCECNSTSCPTGCCNSSNICVPTSGQSTMVCGSGGHACGACANGNACTGGACMCGGGLCAGCCTSTGQCVTTASKTTCGLGGITCSSCGTNQECTGGKCVCDAASCPMGCCDANGQCQTSGDTTCGVGGAACAKCSATQDCVSGSCTCDAKSCPNGCCQGTMCVTSEGLGACGIGGAACGTCQTGDRCDGTTGKCVCDATSCPNGCCDSKGCHNSAFGSCGIKGAACVACSTGTTCNAGACACTTTSCTGCCNGNTCNAVTGKGGKCSSKTTQCSGTETCQSDGTLNCSVSSSPSGVKIGVTNTTCSSALVASGGSGASYSWSGPGGLSATGSKLTATVSGTYTVTATEPDGCVSTTSTIVTIMKPASPAPFAPGMYQNWGPIPSCVTSVTVTLAGGAGGPTGGFGPQAAGGLGAVITATLQVMPGSSYEVSVGNAGTSCGGTLGLSAPYAGGAGVCSMDGNAGSGGDASVISVSSGAPLVVAAGGGGAGGLSALDNGGAGGMPIGQTASGDQGNNGGGGGTATSGGACGTDIGGTEVAQDACYGDDNGINPGAGGSGADVTDSSGNPNCIVGGGGGGGYHGGGGACWVGGGGGSSYANPSVTSKISWGTNSGAGYLNIVYN